MNIIKLQKIILEPSQIKKALESIIYTILFNRLFIYVKPETVYCYMFDICYSKIKDKKIDDKVEKVIFEIIESYESFENLDISVIFYYTNKKSWLNSKISWEKWIIPININKYEKLFKKTNEIKTIIQSVIEYSDSNYLNIPPILKNENPIDLFDIEISSDKESIGNTALNILKSLSEFSSFKF
jgi:hypothetical protein